MCLFDLVSKIYFYKYLLQYCAHGARDGRSDGVICSDISSVFHHLGWIDMYLYYMCLKTQRFELSSFHIYRSILFLHVDGES